MILPNVTAEVQILDLRVETRAHYGIHNRALVRCSPGSIQRDRYNGTSKATPCGGGGLSDKAWRLPMTA